MRNLIWSGFVMAVLLSGCGWSGTASRPNTFTPLTSITITAAYTTIAQGTSVKLTATGNYSGLFSRDISDQVTWTSKATNVASFASPTNPRVSGVAPGGAVLTATFPGGVSGSFNLTVSSATLSFLNVSTAATSLAVGQSEQLYAKGTFSDSTVQDITFDSGWTTSNDTVASVVNTAGDSKGQVTANAIGTATITATLGAISGATALTVTAPVLESIAVTTPITTATKPNPSVLSLSTVTFTATGTYSDGTTPDITSQVTWTSSNPNVAPNPDSTGVTQAAIQGTTNITASLNGITGTTILNVTGGNLVSFSLPTSLSVVNGTSAPITVTGTFSNGTSRDITGLLNWSVASTTPNRATLTGPTGNRLLVNAAAAGTTTITAKSPSQTASTTLSVTSPAISSISVPQASLNLTAGTSGRLTATAYFSDGTSQDVTANATWTSNASTVAAIGAVGPTGVQIGGVTAGSTTINVTFGGLTLRIPIPVTVTARTLQSIAVSPSGTQSLTSGQQTIFTATATYSGGFTQDVTADTTWATGDANIAILPDSQHQPGQVIGVGSGTTSLTATFGNLPQATVTINVP